MSRGSIAFLLGFPEISGGTYVILEHAVQLTKLGFDVSIVTELPFERSRLNWHPEGSKLPLLSHADCHGRMFDVAVATWWRSVFNLPWVPAKRVAYFVQSIETRFFPPSDWDMKALADLTYKIPMPIVTEASWIAEYLNRHYERNTTLVRNGIRKDIYTPDGDVVDSSRPHGLRVLIEGPLLVTFKNVERAISLCKSAGIADIWLLSSSNVTEVPGVSRVFSRVPITECPKIYRSCDLILKLSLVEGMFGPPLEMMHCGGTAITYDVTGFDEYLVDGVNSLVCEIGCEDQVVDALQRVMNTPGLLERLKDGATRTALNWPDWEYAGSQMAKFLDDIIREKSGADLADIMKLLRATLEVAGPLSIAVQRHAPLSAISNSKDRRKISQFIEGSLPTVSRLIREGSILRVTSGISDTGAAQTPLLPARKADSLPIKSVLFVGDPISCSSINPTNLPSLNTNFCKLSRGCDPSLKICQDLATYGSDAIVIFDAGSIIPRIDPKIFSRTQQIYPIFVRCESAAEVALIISNLENITQIFTTSPAHALECRNHGLSNVFSAMLTTCIDFTTQPIAWEARKLDALILGSRAEIGDLESISSKVLYLTDLPPEDTLIELIKNSRMVIQSEWYADFVGVGLAAAHTVRNAICGAVTVTPLLSPSFGALDHEHYLLSTPEVPPAMHLQRMLASPARYSQIARVMADKRTQYPPEDFFLRSLNCPNRFEVNYEVRASLEAIGDR